VDAWADALTREFQIVEAEGLFRLDERLDTVYVGGGTPSLLGPDAMHRVAALLGPARLSDDRMEWTAEANPESLTPELARRWSAAGVNRLSMGAQSFSEAALRWMGRLHGPDGPARALAAARSAGISNVSVDLIFGLPRSLGRSWSDDLDRLLQLDVPHISLYGLTVESATALGRAVREGREAPVDDEQYREEYLEAASRLAAEGYRHYEVSNFARPGAEARHNAVYWSGAPYLGLGNGAHSYAPPLRRWNVRDWELYRSRLQGGATAEEGREKVDPEAEALERAWLELRTARGIENPAEGSHSDAVTKRWMASRLASAHEGRVRLNARGWLELDRLALELDEARECDRVG
jgi:oxygen-independent coproporphyrinogen-3 oxidase